MGMGPVIAGQRTGAQAEAHHKATVACPAAPLGAQTCTGTMSRPVMTLARYILYPPPQGLPEVGTVRSEDAMDDGTPIRLAVTIDRRDGSAVFDFEGTGG